MIAKHTHMYQYVCSTDRIVVLWTGSKNNTEKNLEFCYWCSLVSMCYGPHKMARSYLLFVGVFFPMILADYHRWVCAWLDGDWF